MDISFFRIIKTVFFIWTFIYGFFNLSANLLHSFVSLSLFGIVLLCVLIYVFRVPAPSKFAIETVIGKDPLYDHGHSDNYCMRVVAHRGAPLDAPENSLTAFKLCAEKGCNAVEFDVTLTADNVPIIFHDNTLERLTGSPAVVRELTWDELSQVDISVKHPFREKFVNTRVAKLDDAIVQCLNNRQKMFIDIKEANMEIVKVILDLFKKYPDLTTKAVCSSFYSHIIYMIRRKNPNIVCSVAWRPHFFAYESYSAVQGGVGSPRYKNYIKHYIAILLDLIYCWALPRIIYYMAGLSAVLLHKDAISGQVINDWRQKGVRVIAWTVNHPVEKQHFSRVFKITYMTDTLIGESSAHANNNAASYKL